MLGLGACLLLRARGADEWAAFALGAALLHTLNHAVFKALLFLGAGSFERAVGSLELDRLGGLLRRMPWTGGAFLVGAMAIAGLPPLNGFASEWLTLQALLHVPAYGGHRRRHWRARSRSPRSRRPPRSRCSASSRSSGSCCSGRRAATPSPTPWRRRVPMRAAVVVARGRLRRARGRAGAALRLARRPGAVGRGRARRRSACTLPGTGSLPTGGIALVLVALAGRASSLLRGRRAAAPAPTWACGQLVEPQLALDERRVHEAAAARARGGAAPGARDRRCTRGRRRAGGRPTAAACRT